MKTNFINEQKCYQIFEKYGIKTPKHIFLKNLDEDFSEILENGQASVFKAVVDDVWHKSDIGLINFSEFSKENVNQAFADFYEKTEEKEKFHGVLISEKVTFAKSDLPAEILLSIKNDPSFGSVVTLGFGGIHTELLGAEIKEGVLNFFPEFMSVEDAFEKFSEHLIGKILLGNIRLGQALTNKETIKKFLRATWEIAKNLEEENISFLEINPLVVTDKAEIVAIDGVGEYAEKSEKNADIELNLKQQEALVHPKNFLVAGVSSKKKAFGNIVLDNLKKSNISKENVFVLKPGSEEFDGFSAVSSLKELKTEIDALVLAVPAVAALQVIEEACETKNIKIIHLVSGGIGDGADHSGLKEKLLNILTKYDEKERPAVIGPNSLGMILSPQNINTLFIPEEKLPVKFYPNGNIGLISQSGAFFITRISRNDTIPVNYGICIGNQIDISATEILKTFANDKKIDVIALYLEGAPKGDAYTLAQAISKLNKKVIIYRGGRSAEGMKAAAGHTGALATDYSIEKKLLETAGAIVLESFENFENSLLWYSKFPNFSSKEIKNISVISNAGYESVASADGVGSKLSTLSEKTEAELKKLFEENRLAEIVTPANPLDLTPMASDKVYLQSSEIIAMAEETDMLVVGVVPLTVMLETENEEKMQKNIAKYSEIIEESGKAIAIVVDSGKVYDKFKTEFLKAGIPIFKSVQDIFAVVNK